MNDTISSTPEQLNRFLKMAVVSGVESAVQIHIDRGDDLNARDGNGLTPLMLAATRNKPSICKLLLSAGANKDLLSPSGKTAHVIALEAGAPDVAALFEVMTPIAIGVLPALGDLGPFSCECQREQSDEQALAAEEAAVDGFAVLEVADREADTKVRNLDNAEHQQIESEGPFDLHGWEAEDDACAPEVDPAVAHSASAVQEAISNHRPIDSSEDWDDVDIYLPDVSIPLARAEDAEARQLLRLLVLRAVREGSVPKDAVKALSLNVDQSANAEAEASLTMVINDLGAEVDERWEYVSANENFEVFVSPDETSDETDAVGAALALLDNLASSYSEPLRLYQKEFQRQKLIAADVEVALGKAMESALDQALNALAAWPRGIEATLAAGALVEAGARPLTWLCTSLAEPQPDLESGSLPEEDSNLLASDKAESELDSDENADPEVEDDARGAPESFAREFSAALANLAELTVSSERDSPNFKAARTVLDSLRLSRQFLSELADLQVDAPAEKSPQYVSAIRAYQSGRSRMASANLKLVFHHAKKFLYSGERLDDLAQEGNLGLLKAVDRYDWRRGYKFSTYATWWIRQHIGRYIADKGRTIRVPVHMYDQVQRVRRYAREFEDKHGRPPALDELAAQLSLPTRKVSAIQRIAEEPLPIHDLPIDELIAPDFGAAVLFADPLENAMNAQTRVKVGEVLATLKPKEEQILRLRFGIGISEDFTLEEVGRRYEVTRERVRQIEAKALRALQVPSRRGLLSQVFSGDTA